METYQKWETKGRRREIRKGEIRKKQMVLKELERFVKEEDQQQEDNPKMQQLIKDCHNLPFFKFDQFQYRIITREQHHSTQFLKYSDYNYRLGGQSTVVSTLSQGYQQKTEYLNHFTTINYSY